MEQHLIDAIKKHAGKVVGQNYYLSVWQFEQDEKLLRFVLNMVHGIDYQINMVKFNLRDNKVSLLYYPMMYTEQFPSLKWSYTIDLNKYVHHEHYTFRQYKPMFAPILHRKELFINPTTHKRLYDEAVSLTKRAENLGLFDDTKRIGYSHKWEQLKFEKGIQGDI